MIVSKKISVQTRGEGHTLDITPEVEKAIGEAGAANGVVTLFAVGSTVGLTTLEYEPGVVEDLDRAFEVLAPRQGEYKHHLKWHDDNGHSHVRAALLGPSLSVPFIEGRLTLGTWQQI